MAVTPAPRLTDLWEKCRLVVVMSLILGASAPASGAAPPAPGTTAPPFSGEQLDGGTLALESLRGSVVLLDFWAVDCPPCRIEMPALEKIHRRYSGRGLRVLGVTEMDPARERLVRFLSEVGVTYPILLDPGARIGALYRIEAHPTTLVIDAKGVIRFINTGYLKGEEVEIDRAIQKTLAAGRGAPGAQCDAHGDEP